MNGKSWLLVLITFSYHLRQQWTVLFLVTWLLDFTVQSEAALDGLGNNDATSLF